MYGFQEEGERRLLQLHSQLTPGRSLSRILVQQRGTISVGYRTPLSCCLQSSDQRDPLSPASQSADVRNAFASDSRSQQESSARVVLHCVVSHLRPTAQHNQCRMTNTLVCCLQSSDVRDPSCSALQAPDESDVSATETSQGGERQSDEDSAAEDTNSEESEESEEERSQDDNEAAGLFVRLAKGERKNLQARESLLLDTLRRAKSYRWSELCSRVGVSDGMTEHVRDYARLVLGDDGEMGSCLVARLTYGLRKTHHVTITVVPEKSPVVCFGIGVERRLAVQQPKSGLYVEISPLHSVLRLGNEYQLQVKGNQRAYVFVLFWSTQKGARMELQQPDNAEEGEDTPLHGAQFPTTVGKKVSVLSCVLFFFLDKTTTLQTVAQEGALETS